MSLLSRILFPSVILAVGVLTGCSTTLEAKVEATPDSTFTLVDPVKTDMAKYEKDYADCTLLANQERGISAKSVTNAVGRVAERSTFGILSSGSHKYDDRVTVLKKCLTNRGYTLIR